MLKLLLKKQFKELKYSYFKDKKTGKILEKKQLVGKAFLLIGLYVFMALAFYALASTLVSTFLAVDALWIVFALFSLLTVVFGTFVNMFATRSIIYEAKDNELLMSLPIEEKDVVLCRLVVTYFQCLIYTSLIWLPLIICYLVSVEFNILVLLSGIVMLLVLTLLTTVLSCLFGYIVTLIAKLFKGKSIITTIITLVILAAYYYVYFNAENYLNSLVAHIGEAEEYFIKKGFLFYSIGKASLGNVGYLLLLIFISVLVSFLCYIAIKKNYLKLVRMHGVSSTKKFNGQTTKQKSIAKALIGRELKHYLSNSTYTLNTGLGVVIMLAGTIALIIFRERVVEFTDLIKQIPIFGDMLPILAFGTIACIVSMDCLSTPAVSLEGKNYWIIRTLPISAYDVLDAKRQLQFKMNVVPAIILIFTFTVLAGINDYTQVLLVISVIVYASFISFFDLFLGIKGANLKWTSEVVPVKQASNILIAVFSAFIISTIIAFGYYFLYEMINLGTYLAGVIVVLALLSKFIDNWIKTKGVKEFESLG